VLKEPGLTDLELVPCSAPNLKGEETRDIILYLKKNRDLAQSSLKEEEEKGSPSHSCPTSLAMPSVDKTRCVGGAPSWCVEKT